MKTLWLDKGDTAKEPTVVCLGFFDGVHLGHVSLIEEAKRIRNENGLKVCIHTFDAMPARVLHPEMEILELTPLREKARIFEALGVDLLAVSAFEGSVRHMRAQAFFSTILMEALQAKHIVAGFHHHFGYRGEADVKRLASMCESAGVGLSIIPPVTTAAGELISSTAIREALRAGETGRAARMLGRSVDEALMRLAQQGA